jgi:hypothetical protein
VEGSSVRFLVFGMRCERVAVLSTGFVQQVLDRVARGVRAADIIIASNIASFSPSRLAPTNPEPTAPMPTPIVPG